MRIFYQLPVGLTDEMIWPDYPVEALATINAGMAAGLAAEPKDGGGPITRFIGYKLLGKPRATRDEAQAMLPLGPGDPSPFFDPVDDISRDPNASVVRTYTSPTELVTAGPNDRPDWATPARLALLAMAGGRAYWLNEADGLPVYFTGFALDDVCPFGDGEETWETWGVFGESHKPVEINGQWYRSSAVGQSGANLEIAEWLPFYFAGGTVLTVDEYLAIQQANQPAP